MMSDRYRQRHADVLELLSSGAFLGGEPQAALEAFLIHTSPSTRSHDGPRTFGKPSRREYTTNE
ncbi:hypothetical protein FHX14_004480 [Rhizobium sp. BK619]|uniref:hypothetical protein n=1 Tax=Rhizobium sp. BK619 TaxID=2586989 RepID=UPI00160CC88B|nr:hypothetical protein [Rhizobium sp. BK619]MBB3648255.1 hypothetical protein [Rhizobium sp. BK619]